MTDGVREAPRHVAADAVGLLRSLTSATGLWTRLHSFDWPNVDHSAESSQESFHGASCQWEADGEHSRKCPKPAHEGKMCHQGGARGD